MSKQTLCCLLAIALGSSFLVESKPRDNIFEPSARIVGGNNAADNQFPYFAELGGCGGALIASDIVLFAAHCTGIDFRRQISIGGIKTWEGRPRWCVEILEDPLYRSTTWIDYDYALCKLNRPVEGFNEGNVKLVLNPSSNVPVDNQDMTVIGFGFEEYESDEGMTDDLKYTTVQHTPNDECRESYGDEITDRMLCGGTDEGGQDACSGDSGGPIVTEEVLDDGTVIHTHVGVVSWGAGCADKRYPGVYARTSARYSWIVDEMCNTLQSKDPMCREMFPNSPEPEECPEATVSIILTTDRWGHETRWEVDPPTGPTIERWFRVDNTYSQQDICMDYDESFSFEVRDTYGDGSGPYSVEVDGVEILSMDGNNFNSNVVHTLETGPEPAPSATPSSSPSLTPSSLPSAIPSATPTTSTPFPSVSNAPSDVPSESVEPSSTPSRSPSTSPSLSPSSAPSTSPSSTPSSKPSQTPSDAPSGSPSFTPTNYPTETPSFSPTNKPSASPSQYPTIECSDDETYQFKGHKGTCQENYDKLKKKGFQEKKVLKFCEKWDRGHKVQNYWCRETCSKMLYNADDNYDSYTQCFVSTGTYPPEPEPEPDTPEPDPPVQDPVTDPPVQEDPVTDPPVQDPEPDTPEPDSSECSDDETYRFRGSKGTCQDNYDKLKKKGFRKRKVLKFCEKWDRGFQVQHHWCRETCSKMLYNADGNYDSYTQCFPLVTSVRTTTGSGSGTRKKKVGKAN